MRRSHTAIQASLSALGSRYAQASYRKQPLFTGIIQGVATVHDVAHRPGLRSFTLRFPQGFARGLFVGASVACDGVCLTVTSVNENAATFDLMQQSLRLSTLSGLTNDSRVNVERAAKDGAEIGGHPLSGHVDCQATIAAVETPVNNHMLRIAVPVAWMRYVFAKGYIAINGASLTVAEVNRAEGWFDVWLIPETLRMTTFALKRPGEAVNIEIDRGTQVFVDTVRATLEERLGPLLPALETLLAQRGLSVDALGRDVVPPKG